jgi:uncharacterized protein
MALMNSAKTLLLLVLVYVGAQALVTHYVPSAPYPPSFSATGESIFSSKPESATIVMSVSATGKDAAEALRRNNQVVDTIKAALKGTGVMESDVSVGSLQVWGNYDDKNVLLTQQADTKVTIKVKEVDKVNDVVNAAFTGGATAMDSTTYKPSENNKEEIDARTKAFEKAKNKAEQLAKVSHKRLGKLTSVSEYITPSVSSSGGSTSTAPAAESTISVTLSYELN